MQMRVLDPTMAIAMVTGITIRLKVELPSEVSLGIITTTILLTIMAKGTEEAIVCLVLYQYIMVAIL